MTGYAREGLAGRNFTELVAEPASARAWATSSTAGRARRQPRGVRPAALDDLGRDPHRQRLDARRCWPSTPPPSRLSRRDRGARARGRAAQEPRSSSSGSSTRPSTASSPPTCAATSSSSTRARRGCTATRPRRSSASCRCGSSTPRASARAIMAELRAANNGGVGRLLPTRREIVDQGRRAGAGVAGGVDRLRRRSRGRDGRHHQRPARSHQDRAAAGAGAGEADGDGEAGADRRAGRHHRARAQPAADVGDGLLRAACARRCRPTTATIAPSTSSCARPSAWPRSCARSARITRYETKAYVGSTQILDLDKSTTDG